MSRLQAKLPGCQQDTGQAPGGTASHQPSSAATALGSEQHQDFSSSLPSAGAPLSSCQEGAEHREGVFAAAQLCCVSSTPIHKLSPPCPCGNVTKQSGSSPIQSTLWLLVQALRVQATLLMPTRGCRAQRAAQQTQPRELLEAACPESKHLV